MGDTTTTASPEKAFDKMTRPELVTWLKDQPGNLMDGRSRASKGDLEELATEVFTAAQAPTEPVSPERDRNARVKAAKAEHRALVAWRKAGEKGERPCTVNLDELEAESNGDKPKGKKASGTTGGSQARITDAELDKLVKAWVKANPDSTKSGTVKGVRSQGHSASQTRIHAAFTRVTA